VEAADAITDLTPTFLQLHTTVTSSNVPKENIVWRTTYNIIEEHHHIHITNKDDKTIFITVHSIARVPPSPQEQRELFTHEGTIHHHNSSMKDG
jgi:hypothetical protein